jgi:hypothetical protein
MEQQDTYESVIEEAPVKAKEYIAEVRRKIQLALFSELPTLSEGSKKALIDVASLFCLGAYQKARRDTLEEVQEQFKDYVKQLKLEKDIHKSVDPSIE